MQPTSSEPSITPPWSWQPTADEAFHVRRSLDVTRERLRVARLRASDRHRLADNARAAGQEVFEARLREAADAHAEAARVLEDTMRQLEGCWSRIEMERRDRERAAMRLHARSASASCPGCGRQEVD